MKKRPWTAEEVEIVKKEYANSSTKKVAKKINRTISQVYNIVYKLGLKKDASFIAEQTRQQQLALVKSGKHKGGFKKGQIPHNKGVKMEKWMSAEMIERTKQTRFKNGEMPHNHRPVGTKRKNADGYWYIKVSEPKKWELLHHYNWEKVNPRIKKGYNLIFKDGNQDNCNVENLELITDAELMNKNSFQRFPKELKQLIRLQTKLNKKIKNHA